MGILTTLFYYDPTACTLWIHVIKKKFSKSCNISYLECETEQWYHLSL